jgi:hypothetical protein
MPVGAGHRLSPGISHRSESDPPAHGQEDEPGGVYADNSFSFQ